MDNIRKSYPVTDELKSRLESECAKVGGRKTLLAEKLGISKQQLHRIMTADDEKISTDMLVFLQGKFPDIELSDLLKSCDSCPFNHSVSTTAYKVALFFDKLPASDQLKTKEFFEKVRVRLLEDLQTGL